VLALCRFLAVALLSGEFESNGSVHKTLHGRHGRHGVFKRRCCINRLDAFVGAVENPKDELV
jgi:hypothetical protein